MSNRQTINTTRAPAAGIGSHAVKAGTTVYISGQLPLDPESMELERGGIKAQASRCLENIKVIAEAAGGDLQDAAKIGIYLVDLGLMDQVDEVMSGHFTQPGPARIVVGVAELPKNALLVIDSVLELR